MENLEKEELYIHRLVSWLVDKLVSSIPLSPMGQGDCFMNLSDNHG